MKIIRPEQPQEIVKNIENSVDDKTSPIDYIMEEVIAESKSRISINIILTKRQYDLWLKKGGLSWLKKILQGQEYKKKARK